MILGAIIWLAFAMISGVCGAFGIGVLIAMDLALATILFAAAFALTQLKSDANLKRYPADATCSTVDCSFERHDP